MDDAKIQRAIYGIARERGPEQSLCPADAARKLSPFNWRALMPQVIGAAKRMAANGEIIITQRGKPVDPEKVKGVIRLRLPPEEESP